MKEQTRINIRSRKSAKNTTTDIYKKQVKSIDEGQTINAFRQATTASVEPSKTIQKVEARKSSRIASKLTQTKLSVKRIEKIEHNETNSPKRKLSISSEKPKTKKLKSLEITTSNIETKEEIAVDVREESDCGNEETNGADKPASTNFEVKVHEEDTSSSLLEGTTLIDSEEESTTDDVTKPQATELDIKDIEESTLVESQPENTKDTMAEKIRTINNSGEDNYAHTPHYDQNDSPSPPSLLTEPSTPPVHLEAPLAPHKTYVTEADKSRIEHEKSTLVKLRKALDIVITDRMARNRPTLYHQIEPVLRNSTRRAITISHLCKTMYLAPNLYQLDVKELRDFGGKVTEAFLVQFGSTWKCPLAGKDLQSRANILNDALEDFFAKNKEPDATIPEIKLPRLDLVVDKKEWMKEAKLPPGVKAILEAHKKVDEAEKEKEKPKEKPVGTVKDRMAALRARLAAKKAT